LIETAIQQLQHDWKSYNKKLILVGSHIPDAELESMLAVVAIDDSVVVLTENTSNITSEHFFESTDKLISGLDPQKEADYVPDLLVTIGQRLVSRRIKSWLRKHKALQHWHIDEAGRPIDAYQHLSRIYPLKAIDFLRHISDNLNVGSSYRLLWEQRMLDTDLAHNEFLKSAGYSDLKVFHLVLSQLRDKLILHAGNSTPIRYLQLFHKSKTITYFANRGTSGIDGSLSTAVGYAWNSNQANLVILGDLSFFYDSNGLWNQYLKPNLKIIVINNSGGGIFRIIEGPSTLPELESFFEVKHSYKAEQIAAAFGLSYFKATGEEELTEVITGFLSPQDRPALLEIFTPNELNSEVLNAYFEFLKQ
jgi:2-succinyl-5-enolpyruvyl-6-hydroxy-3-cyclohexene-1-carboxylate synthase